MKLKIHVKIKANKNGLKIFKGLHGQHVQDGPDILTVLAAAENVDFKTTFAPEPGNGQNLTCVIAGETFTFHRPDLTSKEWRTLSDKLTARNALAALATEFAAAEKIYRKKWDENKDPNVIIKFIKKYFNAIEVPWVNEQVRTWITQRHYDLLDKLGPAKGERREENPYWRNLINWAIRDRVNELKLAGHTAVRAFDELSGQKIFGVYYSTNQIKDRYYRSKNYTAEVYVREMNKGEEIFVKGGKIVACVNDKPLTFYGDFVMRQPKA